MYAANEVLWFLCCVHSRCSEYGVTTISLGVTVLRMLMHCGKLCIMVLVYHGILCVALESHENCSWRAMLSLVCEELWFLSMIKTAAFSPLWRLNLSTMNKSEGCCEELQFISSKKIATTFLFGFVRPLSWRPEFLRPLFFNTVWVLWPLSWDVWNFIFTFEAIQWSLKPYCFQQSCDPAIASSSSDVRPHMVSCTSILNMKL